MNRPSASRIGALIAAQRRAQRLRLRIAATTGAIVAVAATCLLGLSGWFITSAALAGIAGSAAVQAFNYMVPSATIRLLAILRTGARYIERVSGHEAALKALARLRPRRQAAPWLSLRGKPRRGWSRMWTRFRPCSCGCRRLGPWEPAPRPPPSSPAWPVHGRARSCWPQWPSAQPAPF